MKPPLCICNGPLEKREPNTWTWGKPGEFYVYREICPIHGAEFRERRAESEGQ